MSNVKHISKEEDFTIGNNDGDLRISNDEDLKIGNDKDLRIGKVKDLKSGNHLSSDRTPLNTLSIDTSYTS